MPPLCGAIDGAASIGSMVQFPEHALRGARLFSAQGKGSWTRALLIAAMTLSRACVTALREASEDRSRVHDVHAGLGGSLRYLFLSGEHRLRRVV